MSTIVARLYPDQGTAQSAYEALMATGCSPKAVAMVGEGDAAAERFTALGIPPHEQQGYASLVTEGKVLMVVQARFGKAFSVARVLDKTPSEAVPGIAVKHAQYVEKKVIARSILKDRTLIMTNPYARTSIRWVFGKDPLIRFEPSYSVIAGGGFMSRWFWPMKLLSASKPKTSAIRSGFQFSKLFGMPTLTRRRA